MPVTSGYGARDRRLLAHAVAIAVSARLVLAVAAWLVGGVDAFYLPDSRQYATLARAMTDGAYALDGQPEIYRPPGYPAFLAIGLLAGAPTLVSFVLQLVLGVVTVLACADFGRTLAGPRAGALAALLIACDPMQWVHGVFLLSEALFTPLLAVALAAAARHLTRPRTSAIVTAAVAGVAAAYVRPIGYAVLPVLIVAVAWIEWRSGRAALSWRSYVVAALVAAALLGAWHVRNGVVAGYWGFSVQFERAAYFGAGASAFDRDASQSPMDGRRALDAGLEDAGGTAPAEGRAFLWRDAAARVLARPGDFVVTWGSGVAATLVHPGAGAALRLLGYGNPAADYSDSATRLAAYGRWGEALAVLRQKGAFYWAVTVVLGLTAVAYLALAVTGAWRSRRLPVGLMLSIVAIVFVLLSGGPDADARRRVPIAPALCALAAAGLVTARKSATSG